MDHARRDKVDAVQRFINRNFEEIPTAMVAAYRKAEGWDSLEDITEISYGRHVSTDDGVSGEVAGIKYNGDEKTVSIRYYDDDSDEPKVADYPADEVYLDRDWQGVNGLPAHGSMWLLDRNYFEDKVTELSECGFVVFDCAEENKLLVGIDGGGYDFFSAHFEKLYDRLGFDWHESLAYQAEDIAKAAVKMGAELGLKPDKIAKKLGLSKEFVDVYMPKVNAR